MENHILGFEQEIYYDCSNQVSIKEVIRSLKGLETIAAVLPQALKELLQADSLNVALELQSISLGSEKLDYLIALNFENDEDAKNFLYKFGKKHPVIKQVINITVVALILGSVYIALSASDKPTTNIQATNSNVVVVGADLLNMSPSKFQEIIHETVQKNPQTTKGVLDLLAPSRNDNKSSIHFGDGIEKLSLEPDLLTEVPLSLPRPVEYLEKDYQNVMIEIRAIDLDHRTKGWSVLVAGLKKRLPAIIYPVLDPDTIKDARYANLSVIYKIDPSDDRRLMPTNIVIKGIGNPDLPTSTVREFIAISEQPVVDSKTDDDSAQMQLFK